MNLSEFSRRNEDRCNEVFFSVDPSSLYWAAAIAEEAGEVCGIVKKLVRGFNLREQKKLLNRLRKSNDEATVDMITVPELEKIWRDELTEKFRFEIADVITYADLMHSKLCPQYRIGDTIKEKFNLVSDEMGLDPIIEPQYFMASSID